MESESSAGSSRAVEFALFAVFGTVTLLLYANFALPKGSLASESFLADAVCDSCEK